MSCQRCCFYQTDRILGEEFKLSVRLCPQHIHDALDPAVTVGLESQLDDVKFQLIPGSITKPSDPAAPNVPCVVSFTQPLLTRIEDVSLILGTLQIKHQSRQEPVPEGFLGWIRRQVIGQPFQGPTQSAWEGEDQPPLSEGISESEMSDDDYSTIGLHTDHVAVTMPATDAQRQEFVQQVLASGETQLQNLEDGREAMVELVRETPVAESALATYESMISLANGSIDQTRHYQRQLGHRVDPHTPNDPERDVLEDRAYTLARRESRASVMNTFRQFFAAAQDQARHHQEVFEFFLELLDDDHPPVGQNEEEAKNRLSEKLRNLIDKCNEMRRSSPFPVSQFTDSTQPPPLTTRASGPSDWSSLSADPHSESVSQDGLTIGHHAVATLDQIHQDFLLVKTEILEYKRTQRQRHKDDLARHQAERAEIEERHRRDIQERDDNLRRLEDRALDQSRREALERETADLEVRIEESGKHIQETDDQIEAEQALIDQTEKDEEAIKKAARSLKKKRWAWRIGAVLLLAVGVTLVVVCPLNTIWVVPLAVDIGIGASAITGAAVGGVYNEIAHRPQPEASSA